MVSVYAVMQIDLDCTTTAALHQIADVSGLDACSNEWLYIIMV